MIANEAPLKKNRVNLSGRRFMLRDGLRLNIMEPVLLRPVEDCDCDMVLFRGREVGAVEAFPLFSSFMTVTAPYCCSIHPGDVNAGT